MKAKVNKFAAAADFIKAAPTEQAKSGGRRPPPSDARLTVNIDRALHLRLKLYALRHATTSGELIEEWIRQHVPE